MADQPIQPGPKKTNGNGNGHQVLHPAVTHDVAFGYPRDFLDNQFVYVLISPRARGLSIGINVNPILKCNFNCMYCELDRFKPARAAHFDVDTMAAELNSTLELAFQKQLRNLPRYAGLPEELLQLRHVALSGDGEPTLSDEFAEAIGAVAHTRAIGRFPFFKMVLVTNSTALDRPHVQQGVKFFTREDEIWAKLDGGTQGYLNKVNGSTTPIENILNNILAVGRQRPVVIQSLFPVINGAPPDENEIREYALRLKELKDAGAEITLVQIYSATRPMARVGCSHLPLRALSRIAQTVRQTAGLRAEVF